MSAASDNLKFPQEALVPAANTANKPQAVDSNYKVIRRNGSVTPFDQSKIEVALTKAFLEVEGGVVAASSRVHKEVKELAAQHVYALRKKLSRLVKARKPRQTLSTLSL